MVAFDLLRSVLVSNGLVTAFAFVGVTVWLSYLVSDKLTRGRVHGSAIAILIGLALAYAGGVATGGDRGLADIEILAGVGLLGGAMIRDLAIIATAFGVDLSEIRKAGAGAIVGLVTGVLGAFVVGATVGWLFGYRDPISMTTIGAGAATYIVGPVTGTAIGATSEVVAHDQRGRRGAGGDGREARSLRCHDRDLLHGSRLPPGPLHRVRDDPGALRVVGLAAWRGTAEHRGVVALR
jgi:malonate transporter MadM subunit